MSPSDNITSNVEPNDGVFDDMKALADSVPKLMSIQESILNTWRNVGTAREIGGKIRKTIEDITVAILDMQKRNKFLPKEIQTDVQNQIVEHSENKATKEDAEQISPVLELDVGMAEIFTNKTHWSNSTEIEATESTKPSEKQKKIEGPWQFYLKRRNGEKEFFTDKTNWSNSTEIEEATKSTNPLEKQKKREGPLEFYLKRHNGEAPFGFCQNIFLNMPKKDALSLEKQKKIEGPYVCTIDDCGQEFSKEFYLKAHKKGHCSEKPLECNDCGQKFSQKIHLKMHELNYRQCSKKNMNSFKIHS